MLAGFSSEIPSNKKQVKEVTKQQQQLAPPPRLIVLPPLMRLLTSSQFNKTLPLFVEVVTYFINL